MFSLNYVQPTYEELKKMWEDPSDEELRGYIRKAQEELEHNIYSDKEIDSFNSELLLRLTDRLCEILDK